MTFIMKKETIIKFIKD